MTTSIHYSTLLYCTVLVLVACNETSPGTNQRPSIVVGLADFHSHQFADRGFNGVLFTHGTDPASACRAPIGFDGGSFRIVDIVRRGLVEEATKQASGTCYPTATNLAGQQMDTDSLKRAWQYGLRLLVVHAVNSEFLCDIANLSSVTCSDRDAIEAQLAAAHELQDKIDSEEGGPGRGWYRIVLSPQEARDAIAAGKLAVVLGVESANAYSNCNLTLGDLVDGVPGAVFPASSEDTFKISCSDDLVTFGFLGASTTLVKGGAAARAIALMEHYRDLGARHFYLVHNLEGTAGGNSLSIPLLHAVANPSDRAPGSPSNRVDDINRVINSARPPFSSWDCSSTYDFDNGRCNSEGLTDIGYRLARMIASYGMLIDIDHLSLKAKGNLRHGEQGLGEQYPLISGHAGFNEINHGAKSNEDQLTAEAVTDLIKWGGALGPILLQSTSTTVRAPADSTVGRTDTYPSDATVGRYECGGTSEGWIQAYRYAVSKLRSTTLYTGEPAFVGVGFGSDFNGLAGWPRPRFGSNHFVVGDEGFDGAFVGPTLTPVGGRCYGTSSGFPETPAHVGYPFKSPLTGVELDKSTLSWSGRSDPYDISFDGVAHVGMIPDFVEELRVIGLTDAELDPLWHGAEAYIRTWEAALSWSSTYTKEVSDGIREECRKLRTELLSWDLGPPDEMLGGERPIDTMATIERWNSTLEQLRTLSCFGSE